MMNWLSGGASMFCHNWSMPEENRPPPTFFSAIILGPNGLGNSLIAEKFQGKVFVTHPDDQIITTHKVSANKIKIRIFFIWTAQHSTYFGWTFAVELFSGIYHPQDTLDERVSLVLRHGEHVEIEPLDPSGIRWIRGKSMGNPWTCDGLLTDPRPTPTPPWRIQGFHFPKNVFHFPMG